jgi:predicted nucleic acid-binding protein
LSTYFVDTSALGKRYLSEVGSSWVRSWSTPNSGNILVIAELTTIEMLSAFSRLLRTGSLSASDIANLRNNFLHHAEMEYIVVPLDTAVVRHARNLVTSHPLRTLDAIQLACASKAVAILSESMTFVSGDNVLLAAASAEGFVTDNPYNHP